MAATKTKPAADRAGGNAGGKADTKAAGGGTAVAERVPPRLKLRYHDEIAPALREEFGYGNVMQTPSLVKIVVNMGVGEAARDAKLIDGAVKDLAVITGQKPAVARARKSIAQFKLREGMPIGAHVTLRGDRMWEFVDRLLSIALPRIRDFRGLPPTSFDGRGNFSLGLREQIIFPEIDYDSIKEIRGLDVAITTTAETDEQAEALLRGLGLPIATEQSQL
jgi:large subunit ribosomal protein L5